MHPKFQMALRRAGLSWPPPSLPPLAPPTPLVRTPADLASLFHLKMYCAGLGDRSDIRLVFETDIDIAMRSLKA